MRPKQSSAVEITKNNHNKIAREIMSISKTQNQDQNTSDIETDSQSVEINDMVPTTLTDLGIIVEKPKRPEYASKSARLNSFHNWSSKFNKLEDMSLAGFYYTGDSDKIRCFFCGGTLKNWEEGDDVFIEHARYFPKCAYISQLKGKVFVEAIQELHKKDTFNKITPDSVNEKMKAMEEEDPSDKKTNRGQELPPELKPYNVLLPTGIQDNSNIVAFAKGKQEEVTDRNLCKVCLEKSIEMVFLPCGHFATCYECSVQLKTCPVCRSKIKGVVRAYIS